LIAVAGGRTEPNPMEGMKNLHATDFTSEQFFEPPNEQKVKLRLSGAAAEPLPGGLLSVKQLRIESYDTNGLTQVGGAGAAMHLCAARRLGQLAGVGENLFWRRQILPRRRGVFIAADECVAHHFHLEPCAYGD
jgi:hypothetical protein